MLTVVDEPAGVDDPGGGAHEAAAGGISGISTQFDAVRSRRRFRVAALLVALLAVAGGCVVLSRTQEADWYLPAGSGADPESTSLTILVVERGCSSGQAPSIVEPEVELGASTVTIAVRTRERLALTQSCQSNPATPVKVDLGEPLGDRELVGARDDLLVHTAAPG